MTAATYFLKLAGIFYTATLFLICISATFTIPNQSGWIEYLICMPAIVGTVALLMGIKYLCKNSMISVPIIAVKDEVREDISCPSFGITWVGSEYDERKKDKLCSKNS